MHAHDERTDDRDEEQGAKVRKLGELGWCVLPIHSTAK